VLKGLRRHYNADVTTNTKLSFPEHSSSSGMCSICIKCGQCEIAQKAKTGRTPFPSPFGKAQFGAEKRLPDINDIQILAEMWGESTFFVDVKTDVNIGGFQSSVPVVIAALGSTKVASSGADILSEGAALAGIPRVVGENVFATFGKEGLKKMIQPYLDNYQNKGAILVQANIIDQKLGVPEMAVEMGAHGIELKLGQGAKQGLGGEIRFKEKDAVERYKKYGYLVLEHGDGSYERHVYPGDITKEGLRNLLIKYSDLNVPLWVKVGVGRGVIELIEELQRIKNEENIPLKCVTVDGHSGGTGMSPWLIMNETCLSSLSILPMVREMKLDFDVLVAGGLTSGVDIAKAIMLGADGAAMGRAMIIAAAANGSKGIVNFVKAIREELQMIATIQRVKEVSKLKNRLNNLIALTEEAGRMFGIESDSKKVL
jgi:hypothetical protein